MRAISKYTEESADLHDFAGEINALHEKLWGLAKRSLGTAIKIGGLLHEQKKLVGHGEWLPWCESNLAFDARTARRYMKLSSERGKLDSVTNLSDAYRRLSHLDQGRKKRSVEMPPAHENPVLPGQRVANDFLALSVEERERALKLIDEIVGRAPGNRNGREAVEIIEAEIVKTCPPAAMEVTSGKAITTSEKVSSGETAINNAPPRL